jgi:hypothetical protein
MIEAKLFLCADSAVVDMRSNSVSLFQIIEQLSAASFPVAVPRVVAFAFLLRDATDSSTPPLQLEVHCGNQQIYSGPMAPNFLQQLQAKAFVEMHGLVIPAPAPVRFVLRNGETTIGSWGISVSQVGQPTGVQMYLPATPVANPS